MTQQEIIREFSQFPRPVKSAVLRRLLQVFEDDLNNEDKSPKKALTKEERISIVKSLNGSIKMDNPPMTKEEVRDAYYGSKPEKFK